MKKLTLTLTAAALALGALALTASAQTQLGAASLHAQLQNATPIVRPIACNGRTGVHGCGPGWFWRFGRRGWACYAC
jgi:Spy/CpxP family protein refolding chaperone